MYCAIRGERWAREMVAKKLGPDLTTALFGEVRSGRQPS
jgi:hypothetical protein